MTGRAVVREGSCPSVQTGRADVREGKYPFTPPSYLAKQKRGVARASPREKLAYPSLGISC